MRSSRLLLVTLVFLNVGCNLQSSDYGLKDKSDTVASASNEKEVTKVSILYFSKPCFECRKKDLKISEVLELGKLVPLDATRSIKFINLIENEGSYIRGYSKPCPPVNAIGVVVESGKTLYLYFPSCGTLRRVTEDGVFHEIENVDPIASQLDALLIREKP